MRPIALLSGPFFHHLDHLAPLAHFFNCPLLVDDSETYRMGKVYYPEVNLQYRFVDLQEIAREYNTIILSTKYARKELEQAYRAMNIHHMRFCYCPHGQSDKGLSDPTMIPEEGQDIVLFYGNKQKERLGLQGPTIGNFRFAYYEKFRPFFDELVGKELSSFPEQKTILYAPTWNDHETATTFFNTWRELAKQLPDNYNLIIKLHPLLEKHHPGEAHAALGLDKSRPNIRVLFEFPPIYPLLNRTDIYLGDYSAIGYDFLHFNRPLFFLGTHTVPLHSCGMRINSVADFFETVDHPQHTLYKQRFDEYTHTFSHFSRNVFSELLG